MKSFKKFLPDKSTIIKSLIIIFIIGLVSTYLTSALYQQQRVTPNNPLEDEVTDYSEVPLFGGYLDLVHADERVDDQSDSDEQKETDQEENDDQDKEDEKKENTASSAGNDDNEAKDNEENEDNQSGTDERSIESGSNSKDAVHTEDEEGEATNDANEASPHAEIVDPKDDETDEIEEINNYFETSIQNGEVTTSRDYTFTIKQLEHDYLLQDIDVTISTEGSKLEQLSQEDDGMATVNLQLVKGENDITVAVTYKDDSDAVFTVLRNYTVIYDEKKIVIET